MTEASCHCGAVRLICDAAPTEVTDCNCSICAAMACSGPIIRPASPPDAATDTYMWDDRSIAFHRCRTCGCVTHWSAVDKTAGRMGVNAHLMARQRSSPARGFASSTGR
jgi:hypothetical protein